MVFKKRYFSDGISQESIDAMTICFDPKIKTYSDNDTILRYSDQKEKVGIVLSGNAKLYYIDENGDTGLLETYSKGDILGDVFSLPIDNYEYLVNSDGKCEVMFIDYHHIVTPCEKSCQHHSQLISNLFIMTAQKSQALSLHISILNQHSIRKKLLAFLKYIRSAASSDTFEIPMSLSALAEYLCVDRSALMREIKAMNEDGTISSERRTFKII